MASMRGAQRTKAALRLLIDRVLDRPDVQVLIGAAHEDENKILGWLACTRLVNSQLIISPRYVVHYAYVRDDIRRKGIMRELLLKQEVIWPCDTQWRITYTFPGPTTKALEKTLLSNAVHVNPSTFLESR